MYYRLDLISGKLEQIKRDDLMPTIIVKTPSKEAFWKLAKKVSGDCTSGTLFKDIPLNVEKKYVVGDPVEFIGIARRLVDNIHPLAPYLEIELSKDVFLYSNAFRGRCGSLELKP